MLKVRIRPKLKNPASVTHCYIYTVQRSTHDTAGFMHHKKNPNSGDELFYWYIVATVCVLTKLRVRTGGAKGNKLHLCNV